MRRRKAYWAAAFLMLSTFQAAAQPSPDTLWTRMLGSDMEDYANALVMMGDGGFLLVGATENHWGGEDEDLRVMRTDSLGQLIWLRQYGVREDYERGFAVARLPGARVVVSMYITDRNFGNYRPQLWEMTEDGDTLRSYRVPWVPSILRPLPDGGLMLAGIAYGDSTDDDFWVARLDSSGTELWSRTWGGWDFERCHDLALTADGGFIAVGMVPSPDPSEVDYDPWVVRGTGAGDTLWCRYWGGLIPDEAWAVDLAADGGCIVAGRRRCIQCPEEFALFVLRYDSVGTLLWDQIHWGGLEAITPKNIYALPDGGWIVSGDGVRDSHSRIFAMRLDSLGDQVWFRVYDGYPIPNVAGISVGTSLLTPDGGLVMLGTIQQSAQRPDFYLMKLAPAGTGAAERPVPLPETPLLEQNYPNPFNGPTRIRFHLPRAGQTRLVVFDLTGREVWSRAWELLPAGPHEVEFDGGERPSGILFYRLESPSGAAGRKMLLVK